MSLTPLRQCPPAAFAAVSRQRNRAAMTSIVLRRLRGAATGGEAE